MPAVMKQVNKMSAEEKLRLIAYIVESMTDKAEKPASPPSAQWKNGYPRPCVSDFIGYCQNCLLIVKGGFNETGSWNRKKKCFICGAN